MEKFASSDRAAAAYDSLMASDPGYLRSMDLGNPAETARTVTAKLRPLKIPWT